MKKTLLLSFFIIFSLMLIPSVEGAFADFDASGTVYLKDRDGNTDRTPSGFSACAFNVGTQKVALNTSNQAACDMVEDGRYKIEDIDNNNGGWKYATIFVTVSDVVEVKESFTFENHLVLHDREYSISSSSSFVFNSLFTINDPDPVTQAAFWMSDEIFRGWDRVNNDLSGHDVSQVNVIYPFEISSDRWDDTIPAYLGGNFNLYTEKGESHIGDAAYLLDVLHEYGHHVHRDLIGSSDFVNIQSCPDEGHRFIITSNAGCAWSEGFAEYFPFSVLTDKEELRVDFEEIRGERGYNIEEPSGYLNGIKITSDNFIFFHHGKNVEGRVAATLHDIWDRENDGENLKEGNGNILKAIKSPKDDSSARTFIEFYLDWNETIDEDIDKALQKNTINQPFIPQKTSKPTSSNLESNTLTISWTAPQSREDIKEYEVFRSASPKVSIANVTADTLIYTDNTVLPETTYTISAKNEFGAGEESDPLVLTTLEGDTTPPKVPVISTSTTLTNSASFTVDGTAEAESTVELFIGFTSQGTVTATSGTWSKIITLSEDSNSITATATDEAGNTSSSSSALTVTLDTIAPTFEVNGNTADFNTSLVEDETYSQGTITNISESSTQQLISGTVDNTKAGTYTVTYTVTDQAGNTGTITETVTVLSNTKPVIELTGESNITLEVGTAYNELGYTATDNEDGDLTNDVVITGTVDHTSLGTYTLSYDVSDSKGLAADTVQRTVTVQDTTPPSITAPATEILYNLLDNPYSLSSWTITQNGGDGWSINSDNSFGTSYGWAKAYQTITIPDDLKDALQNKGNPEISVSEQYSKTYCGEKTGSYKNNPAYDRYYLEISLLDSSGNTLEKKSTGIIQMKDSCTWNRNWHTAQLDFDGAEIPDGIHSIKIEHGGISGEWWKGYYGPAMKDISLVWSR